MSEPNQAYRNILDRLNLLRKREKIFDIAKGAFVFLSVLIIVFILSTLIEALFHFTVPLRWVLLLLSLSVLVTVLFYFIVKPVFSYLFRQRYPDDITLALKIGKKYAQIKDLLADAIEVYRKHENNREGYSLDLVNDSLSKTYQTTKAIDFSSVASAKPIKTMSRFFAVSLLFLSVIFLIFSTPLTKAGFRLINPSVEFAAGIKFNYEISPGDKEVVKGDDIVIQARVWGNIPENVNLFLKNNEADNYEKYKLKSGDSLIFKHKIEKINNNKDYYLTFDGEKSDNFSISVIERPFVRNIQLKLNYPSYSSLDSQYLDENVGDVSALKGTKVELLLHSNKTVKSAQIVFDDQSVVALNISGQEMVGEFVINHSGSYQIVLVDQQELKSINPIEYHIAMIDDQYPIVDITFPGQDVDLNKDMLLPLTIETQDDFGISRLRVGYSILQQAVHESGLAFVDVPFEQTNADKLLINFIWDLTKIQIFPEDVVSYYVEVFDNDKISGPKSSKSLTYRVRFPSIEEMYDEVDREHEEAFEQLEDLYEETKEIKESIDEIVQEMKKDPELNWEEKQEVQDAAQAQGKMQKELEQLQEKLDNMINRMEQNDLVSQETLEKYRELQSLLNEMLTEEMKEAIEKLQKSMEELEPTQLKETMEKFSQTEEDFLKSMERTLNLLKKMQIQQKLDESIRKAQELQRKQEELNQNLTDETNQEEQEKYARDQKVIKQDSENLNQDLEDLKKSMNEFPQMPQQKIESARQQSNDLSEQMQNAIDQLQSGQMQSAQQSGKKISEGLQQMIQTLQDAQKQLSEDEKRKIMQALKRSSHDLLGLSKQQEAIVQNTKGVDRNNPGISEMADNQQNLLSGLNRVTSQLYELSKNTFFVSPEIGKALGKATKGMQESLQELEERRPGGAAQKQEQAMAGLNEAASQIRSSMQSLQGASSGIGFNEMMQRMLGLSQQQQGINQGTQGMGQEGQLSMEQQAALSRLAAEQNAVRKALEQLMHEAGNQSDVLGDMAKVQRDMEDVVNDLQNRNVDRSTIDRQKRILSRLLDAQRSVHNRDYSRERKAEAGKSYQVFSPVSLPDFQDKNKEKLKNELLKAMKEGYSKDYKELIQKYFEALANEEHNATQ